MEGWTDGWTDMRMDGRTDRKMDGRTDRWMDGHMGRFPLCSSFTPFGVSALFPINLNHKLIKQGMATAAFGLLLKLFSHVSEGCRSSTVLHQFFCVYLMMCDRFYILTDHNLALECIWDSVIRTLEKFY